MAYLSKKASQKANIFLEILSDYSCSFRPTKKMLSAGNYKVTHLLQYIHTYIGKTSSQSSWKPCLC